MITTNKNLSLYHGLKNSLINQARNRSIKQKYWTKPKTVDETRSKKQRAKSVDETQSSSIKQKQ
jgi:hypothetical protein